MHTFKVTVEVEVEARDLAAAGTLVQKAITEHNAALTNARMPERLTVESLTVEKPKPRR